MIIGYDYAILINNPPGASFLLSKRAVEKVKGYYLGGDGDDGRLDLSDDIGDVGQHWGLVLFGSAGLGAPE